MTIRKSILILAVVATLVIVSMAAPQRFNRQNNFNNNNNNFRNVQPVYAFGLDTSDGKYAKFNGPVKGLPPGHGGGRYGAADCLLCATG